MYSGFVSGHGALVALQIESVIAHVSPSNIVVLHVHHGSSGDQQVRDWDRDLELRAQKRDGYHAVSPSKVVGHWKHESDSSSCAEPTANQT